VAALSDLIDGKVIVSEEGQIIISKEGRQFKIEFDVHKLREINKQQ